MASVVYTARLSARLAAQQVPICAAGRGFRSSALDKAPQKLNVPARKERPTPQEETAGGLDTTESSPSSAEAPPSSKPQADASAGGAAANAGAGEEEQTSSAKPQKQKYPLYPSVEHLLHYNGMTKEEADKIPASGPRGRLLKGDVLAYVGKINKNYPAESSARLLNLSHLDLSNIQVAKPTAKPEAPAKEEAEPAEPELPQKTEIALPISLSAVIATQKRVQDGLGIFLPLSTFIARASQLANEALPLSRRKPTADDLFNSILGLDKVSKSSRGHYIPQVTGLASTPLAAPARSAKKPDIIDTLATKKAVKSVPRTVPGAAGVATGENLFSVLATAGEEKRAAEYLERMKMVLEKEPGKLVL